MLAPRLGSFAAAALALSVAASPAMSQSHLLYQDLTVPPAAGTPRGTVQRVPVVLPDPRDPVSKIDELPAPPKLATAPKEPRPRQSETWLIGEEVLPPTVSRRAKGQTIAIQGQHDMPSARKPRIAGPTRR